MAEITIPLERYDSLIRCEERVRILLNKLNTNDYIHVEDILIILEEGCKNED